MNTKMWMRLGAGLALVLAQTDSVMAQRGSRGGGGGGFSRGGGSYGGYRGGFSNGASFRSSGLSGPAAPGRTFAPNGGSVLNGIPSRSAGVNGFAGNGFRNTTVVNNNFNNSNFRGYGYGGRGYGGYYPGYYGGGFGYGGFGYGGLGFGFRLGGLGIGFGYPYGLGYLGGYGYSPYYSAGYYFYNPYYTYVDNSYPAAVPYAASGYASDSGTASFYPPTATPASTQVPSFADPTDPSANANANDPASALAGAFNPADPVTMQAAAGQPSAFAAQGEAQFKAEDYNNAVRSLRHALVDDRSNGGATLLLGQALFALGHYDEAAGAIQQGLQTVAPEHWGEIVGNYSTLYRSNDVFTKQLRSLEAAIAKNTTAPALRFVAGYQYGFLGYPKEAVAELDQVLKLAPADQMAKKLRDYLAPKIGTSFDKRALPAAQSPING